MPRLTVTEKQQRLEQHVTQRLGDFIALKFSAAIPDEWSEELAKEAIKAVKEKLSDWKL